SKVGNNVGHFHQARLPVAVDIADKEEGTPAVDSCGTSAHEQPQQHSAAAAADRQRRLRHHPTGDRGKTAR
ncbi:MAG: hypothetical protein Q8J97_13425, partial [Flavobacteriaceae bacterium]|nr:hypothetical protein [Flavobacteriaceae bacterium]